MGVLEGARKVYSRLLSERSSGARPSFVNHPGDERNERDETTPPPETGTAPSAQRPESPPVGPLTEGPVPAAKAPAYRLVNDSAGLGEVIAAIEGAGLVALDTETTGLDPRADRVRLISLATEEGGPAWLVDCFAVDPSPLWSPLSSVNLAIHNAAFDLAFLARMGLAPEGAINDTMLLAQLLAAGTAEKVALAACCRRYLGQGLDKGEQRSDWTNVLTPAQLVYAARDVLALHPLLRALREGVEKAGLRGAAEIEQHCVPAMVWMAGSGVGLDRASWLALADTAELQAEALGRELALAAPPRPNGPNGERREWNFNSSPQLREMFALAGCPIEKADDETLVRLDHPLAALLRRYRSAKKKASTYGRDWLKHLDDDGRVRCDWRQIGTKTGRMACRSPNLQNLPRDAAYRRGFRAPPGRVLVKADLSQIELRIAAKVAGDEAMIGAFRRGEDLHALTARQLTGREAVTRQERQLAKPVNFGLIYGQRARGLARKAAADYGVEMTVKDAERYRGAFLKAWPGISRWHEQIQRDQRRQCIGKAPCEVRTLSGRRVVVDPALWHGARANFAVQGTGGDGIKLALALLWQRREQAPGAIPVLAVHDEIVVECDAGQAGQVAGWLKQAMIDGLAALIDPVPVEVEVSIARTWGGD